MSNSYTTEFGMGDGDESLSNTRYDRLKMKTNESYRMSFCWFRADDSGNLNLEVSPRFIRAKRFYINGLGYVIDNGSAELARLAGGSPSKEQIATIVALWPVDRSGNLDKTRFANGNVEVKPWVFSKAAYDVLKTRNTEFPLNSCDMLVKCTDEKFQKMDVTPCRESLFRKCVAGNAQLQAISNRITAEVRAMESHMDGVLARNLTIEQIREKVGTAPVATPGNASLNTSQIDDMVGDLLD